MRGRKKQMSTQETQQKYSYTFRMEARKPGWDKEGPSKAEVQAYINEVLGVKPAAPGSSRPEP